MNLNFFWLFHFRRSSGDLKTHGYAMSYCMLGKPQTCMADIFPVCYTAFLKGRIGTNIIKCDNSLTCSGRELLM